MGAIAAPALPELPPLPEMISDAAPRLPELQPLPEMQSLQEMQNQQSQSELVRLALIQRMAITKAMEPQLDCDPDVRQLCARFDIEERIMYRLNNVLSKRKATF